MKLSVGGGFMEGMKIGYESMSLPPASREYSKESKYKCKVSAMELEGANWRIMKARNEEEI
jgi:hypothetical protein